jgi:hypothetical protein
MAASSDFTSAKTKGEGLYISLRAVLENPQKTKTKPPGLCMIALTTTCCAQQTGMHKTVVEALLVAIYSTWVTS